MGCCTGDGIPLSAALETIPGKQREGRSAGGAETEETKRGGGGSSSPSGGKGPEGQRHPPTHQDPHPHTQKPKKTRQSGPSPAIGSED